MEGLGEEVGGEGVLDFWVVDGDVGEDGFLAEDVVQVATVPDVLVGEVFGEVAVALSDWQDVEG